MYTDIIFINRRNAVQEISKTVCTPYVPVHTGMIASSTFFHHAFSTPYIPSKFFIGKYIPTYLKKFGKIVRIQYVVLFSLSTQFST